MLPNDVVGRVGVEMAGTLGWDRYTGFGGSIVGMHSFGASAPIAALQAKFGFTVDAVLEAARKQAKRTH